MQQRLPRAHASASQLPSERLDRQQMASRALDLAGSRGGWGAEPAAEHSRCLRRSSCPGRGWGGDSGLGGTGHPSAPALGSAVPPRAPSRRSVLPGMPLPVQLLRLGTRRLLAPTHCSPRGPSPAKAPKGLTGAVRWKARPRGAEPGWQQPLDPGTSPWSVADPHSVPSKRCIGGMGPKPRLGCRAPGAGMLPARDGGRVLGVLTTAVCVSFLKAMAPEHPTQDRAQRGVWAGWGRGVQESSLTGDHPWGEVLGRDQPWRGEWPRENRCPLPENPLVTWVRGGRAGRTGAGQGGAGHPTTQGGNCCIAPRR